MFAADYGRIKEWGVEGEKLFASLRSVCLNYLLAPNVEKRPLESKSHAMKDERS